MKIKLFFNFLLFLLIASGFVFAKSAYADTVSGHVYDYSGNAVQGQVVSLKNSSGTTVATSTTDSSGSYSLSASGGTYRLDIKGTNNSLSLQVPQNYTITNYNYSFSGTTTFDITIPLNKVTIHVQDSSSNPISGARIGGQDAGFAGTANDNLSVSGVTGFTSVDSYSSSTGPLTDSSGNVSLYLIPNDSPYNYTFAVTPPSGSGYGITTINNVTVTSDTTQNLTLQSPVTLSGHIYDELGNAVANQTITLTTAFGATAATQNTDSSGNYSLSVEPNTYTLRISKSNNSLSVNLPQNYNLYDNTYSISSNTTMDVTIPVKQVSVHVQNFLGDAVSGVVLKASDPGFAGTVNDSLTIGGGSVPVTGIDSYTSSTGPTTDSSGNATLWLFPTDSPYTYTYTALKPSGSVYTNTNVANITFTSDNSITITMQQPMVTLSAHVYDPSSTAVSGQQVILKNATSGAQLATSTTDSSGNYSISAPTGTYRLDVVGSNNSLSLHVPQNYTLSDYSYVLSGNTSTDITIPSKEVDVNLKDAAGNNISGSTISASDQSFGGVVNDNLTLGTGITGVSGTDSYSSSTGPTTNSSGNATLWLLGTNSPYTYTFLALPPSGSYTTTTQSNVTFTSNTSLNMSMQQTITFSGHVYDYLGNPVSGQNVILKTSGGTVIASSTSDSSGNYSMSAQTGTYRLDVTGSSNSLSLKVSQNYTLSDYSYNLTQSTNSLDITIPVKKVDIHVQDSSSTPVSGVVVSASDTSFGGVVNDNLTIGTGATGVTGTDTYSSSTGPTTDSSGNATLYLFPTNSSYTYDFVGTPPGGSGFSTTTLSGITFTANHSETITLN
ncbi:MAG TPA: carboxypeptidase-like regulatory domain-containing protein [Methylomirabilota bacterium]|nr:carboxypeptidase-like regulatory domain-containing protein [Methylomirabilota bacterium]